MKLIIGELMKLHTVKNRKYQDTPVLQPPLVAGGSEGGGV